MRLPIAPPRSFISRPTISSRPKQFHARQVTVRSTPFEYESYLLGKSIILFVLFYTTANWWFYKREREDMEKIYESKHKEKHTKKEDKKDK
jgi:hypothetical protein